MASEFVLPVVRGPERLLRTVAGVGILGGPLCYLVGSALHPPVQELGQGALTIAENARTDGLQNAVHLVAYVLASFLLPVGAAGLGYLAMRRTRWLGLIAGALGVFGWLPFAALTALDELARVAALQPDAAALAGLYGTFETGPVMTVFLISYVAGHLVAYVLVGAAFLRGRVGPRWAALALIISSPLTMAGFLLPGHPVGTVGVAGLVLLAAGCVPSALLLIRPRPAMALA